MKQMLFAVLLAVALLFAGCATQKPAVVVIAADREVHPMTAGDIVGWFVPDATMAELMENTVLADHCLNNHK